jgi:Uri superfamily endonuclease
MNGSYIILLELKKDEKIKIGRLGSVFFNKGIYTYVGSALNGLEQRIKRHLIENKKMHWHIDFLLKSGEIKKIFYKEDKLRKECVIADKLSKGLEPILGFGCSDCKCRSHLFFGKKNDILERISELEMLNFPLST